MNPRTGSPSPDARFGEARELFLRGVQAFESGDAAQAEQHFIASLERVPGRVSTLANLAAARLHLGRPQDALHALDQALVVAPDDAPSWWQRAQVLAALGRTAPSVEALERYLALQPGNVEAWLHQAQWLLDLGRPEAALEAYGHALALDPAQAGAWTNRGLILKDLGRCYEATKSFRAALEHHGDVELNRWYLAALDGASAEAVPAQAPAAYVQGLFDQYAGDFESHLVNVLHYQAHEVLVRGLVPLAPGRFKRALDLGCGTGLCAPLLQPLADDVDAVDISANMVRIAHERGQYSEITQADVTDHLRSTSRRYDLVVATDVFVYIGDLAPVFAGVSRVLEAGGWFCFSVEAADADSTQPQLRASLRYAHPETYLRALAARHGFTVERIHRDGVREEQGWPIPGLYLYVRLP